MNLKTYTLSVSLISVIGLLLTSAPFVKSVLVECTPKMRQPVKPRFKLGLEDLWKCLEGCSLGSSSRPLLMS